MRNETIIIEQTKAGIEAKMIDFYCGSLHDINHFIKVHAFAALIGKMEGLDARTQDILEIASIVHDIACPACREKYGNADGSHQEAESEPLLLDFLREFALPADVMQRVIYLVTHHHTYTNVDGPDYQILLEADFLVNAGESEKYAKAVGQFRSQVFRTRAGIHFLDEMYIR